ncbi:glycosyl transferase family 1 [Noviherbaspirillum autotrophicum]|uniref:Glycosyl transferase family 1 n=2 Tax=Noviherbaspirillum autotrophicum TaxID=709839 RepID=A0A0C2BJY7_9BURK|nr:glycosyl transferase family 1 [Noviherbaspirillum autotrophicum]
MKARGLRIGLVGPLPPPSGGMANQTLQLARLLREDGATVEVIQVNAPYSPRWVERLKGIRAGFRLVPYLVRLWRSSSRVDLYHIMANSGWSWHLFAAPAVWIARMAGKPVIVNYRGGEAESFFDKAFTWVKPTMDQADAIIVPSDFLGSVFGNRGWQARIVPNIIDMGRFSAVARVASTTPAAPCILVARNLEPIYDNATALRAFEIVKRSFPSARLVIAGSGPQRHALETLASELGVERAVIFAGRVENEDMAKLYREADVAVNPSLADNMPISILEALACGVPVVSTNVGGIPKLVEHDKTAILVPPQCPEKMADAILAVLCDPAKASRLKKAGSASVRRYTWPKVRLRLLEVYQDVLAQRGQLVAKTK